MKIEQIYTGCLAQGAYYIESEGEAVVIDPLREVDSYITRAKKDHAVIRYVFETHFHADFVSGHLDLSNKTGAEVVYGPMAEPSFAAHIASDGELIKVGKISFKVLHTPGHTMESSCFLLFDEDGRERALFTGDTLFIGDVGRPDLAQKAAHKTKEELAGILYDSLQSKVLTLPDHIIIYPGHGAGSACGKNMSNETTDTLGHQKKSNYALRSGLTREQFVKEVTSGLLPPPVYFPSNAKLNKQGYESLDKVLDRGLQALAPQEFEALANESEALVIDTRTPQEFAECHIPGSINIGIDGNFAPWVGALVPDINQAIQLVAPVGREKEVVTRLARVGYDRTIGFLKDGFGTWKKSGRPTDHVETVTVEEFERRFDQGSLSIIDVRRPSEYEAGHVTGALNLPLDYINDRLQQIDKSQNYYVYCSGGYRSMIFISILKARGFHHLVNLTGGYNAVKQAGKENHFQTSSIIKSK